MYKISGISSILFVLYVSRYIYIQIIYFNTNLSKSTP